MLKNLIESESKGLGWLKNPWVVILSIGVHVVLLGALVWAASVEEAAATEEIDPEEVTYIDVTEIPPPPDPEPMPEQETPQAQPQQPQQQAAPPQRQPRQAPPEVTEPDQPAGFQELQAPDELAGIPEPAPSQEEVRAEDFGGRGAAGGVSGGEPAEETGGGAGGQGEAGGVSGGTYTANMVDRAVSLRNASELQTEMKRRYPSHLRDAGVGGRVMAQFVVDENGRVEPGSIRIISSQHPDLGEQTRRALTKARFTPAKKGDRNVRQLVRMPIVWQPDA